jgi:hypothetical protein
MSNRWRRLDAAGAARAHRSSALHGYGAPFSVFSLPPEPVECEELTKGVSYRWGGGLRGRTRGGKVQASIFSDSGGTVQGSAHDKAGPNGCGAERRTPVSGQWSSRSVTHGVVMKGANLRFVLVFFEIPA